MAGVGIRAPVRSVIGMAVETAPGQSGVAGLLLDEREQVDWSRSVARRPCAIAEGKSASRPRDKNRMLTMRVHNTCCSRKLTEQKKLTQLDWLAKIFVKLTSFGNTVFPNDVKMPSRFGTRKGRYFSQDAQTAFDDDGRDQKGGSVGEFRKDKGGRGSECCASESSAPLSFT